MPQYFFHIPVILLSLSEPDKRISHTYGSPVGHSVCLRPTKRVQVFAESRCVRPIQTGQSLPKCWPGVCPTLTLTVEPFEQYAFYAIDIVAAPTHPFELRRQIPKILFEIPSVFCLRYAIHTWSFPSIQAFVAGSQVIHITNVMIQTGKYQFGFLTGLFTYPCQVCCHRLLTLCIATLFLPSRTTNRGNLRSAGVSRLIARPLRYTGSHHSRRGHPPSLLLTLGGVLGYFHCG